MPHNVTTALRQPPAQPRIDLYVLGAVALALLIRLLRLGGAALWHDEVETALWAGLSPAQAIDTVLWRIPHGRYDPNHLPFYFVIVNAWAKIAGHSAWALRFPSVIFSVVTVALVAGLARTLGNARTARWAAWLAAISPYLLHHAQEARMYPLVSALAAASLWQLARFLTGESSRLGIGFVLVNVAMLATHYYTVFLIGAELLLLPWLSTRAWQAWGPAALVSAGTAFLLAYVALFLTPHTAGERYSLQLFAFPGVVWSMVSGYTLLPSSEELHAVGSRAVRPYLVYALLTAIPLAVIGIAGVKAMYAKSRCVILVTLGCILLGPFVVYTLFTNISINPRYFMPGVPVFLTLLAAGMPDTRRAYIRNAAAAVVIVIMLSAVALHFAAPGQKREDIMAAGKWLDTNAPAQEVILLTSDEMASMAYYHWPHRQFRLYPERTVAATAQNAASLAQDMPFESQQRAIYLFGRAWLSDPTGALRNALQSQYTSCPGVEVRGIQIYCFLNPSAPAGSK